MKSLNPIYSYLSLFLLLSIACAHGTMLENAEDSDKTKSTSTTPSQAGGQDSTRGAGADDQIKDETANLAKKDYPAGLEPIETPIFRTYATPNHSFSRKTTTIAPKKFSDENPEYFDIRLPVCPESALFCTIDFRFDSVSPTTIEDKFLPEFQRLTNVLLEFDTNRDCSTEDSVTKCSAMLSWYGDKRAYSIELPTQSQTEQIGIEITIKKLRSK